MVHCGRCENFGNMSGGESDNSEVEYEQGRTHRNVRELPQYASRKSTPLD